MTILAGLGNPGSQYADNRHNIGFVFIDRMAHHYGFSSFRSKFSAMIADGKVHDRKCLAVKPMTFMNDSGRALAAAVHFYKLSSEAVYVMHDDIDLAPGVIRCKIGGSAGGHNGLKSMDAHIGRDYHRIRIGVGHPGDKTRVNAHVLRDFTHLERDRFHALAGAVTKALPSLLSGDTALFLNSVRAACPGADTA